jgi:long-chain acyl-CoA synthetase
MDAGSDLDLTLGLLLRRAATRTPHAPAMRTGGAAGTDVDGSRTWTWASLDAHVDAVAAHLLRAGVRHGEPVAFACEKRPEVVLGLLACARMGAIYVPVNHRLPVHQIQDLLTTAGVTTLVVEDALEPLARRVRALLRRTLPIEALLDLPPATEPVVDVTDPDTPCYDNLTSGSTGRPKVARTTHRQIVANALSTIEGLGFRAQDVYLGMFAVFAHPHELFHRSLVLGGAFVIVESVSPRIVAEAIARHGVTWVMAVPSFYEMLLDHQAAGGPALPSLRVLEAGGAWVSPEALARMESAFGARFLPVWGATEVTGVGLGMAAGDGQARQPGATGRPMPGLVATLVDDDGVEVSAGDVGELVLEGEMIALGYVNQPEETARRFASTGDPRARRYRTGDHFRRDPDGWYWFVGRHADMLKIAGIRVYPLEIEQAVGEHPEVRAVVVLRGEDRVRGEIARAVVERAPGSTLGVRALQAWCRARLASYKVPRQVVFVERLPRLPNGKLDRVAVRDGA